jgi:glycosyltransferase involved in cell wall biosynthesis
VSWRGSPTNCTVARSIFFYTDSRTLGGAEHALFMLASALDRTAWQPTLLLDEAPGVEPLAQRAAEFDVPVRFIPPMPLGLTGACRVPGLVRTLRVERPAVFHAHLSWPLAAKYAVTAAIIARVPAIVATVQLIPEFELDCSSRVQLRALSARVGRYIAVSRAIATELIERFRWPADKIEVVYNAVELERFDISASPARSGDQRPVVLTCARLDEQKGHQILLAAAAEVPEAVFVLAGEGPERAALEGKAAELGISDRVRFLGHRTDISELLATCDVFALPSFYEGSSLAVLEAMAARRPVVSSTIGGTDELIDDGETGLLVPPGDAGALGVALRRLLADASLRDSLASRARKRVELDFSREEMGRRVTQIYEELLDG